MKPVGPIGLDAIRAARSRIAGAAIRSPLLPLDVPGAATEVWVKLECLQPIGSFKIRGAANAMALADPARVAAGVYDFLKDFWPRFNAAFMVEPKEPKSAFLRLLPSMKAKLPEITLLCLKTTRTVRRKGNLATAAFVAFASTSHLAAQPSITVRDSIVLQESGDDYLVLPSPVVPDGSGGYLVADHGQAGVFHYSATGRLMRRYGREGEGPGEWKEADVALPWGDEQVMVLSWSPYAIQLFRRSDGQFVERHPLNTPVESVVPGSGELWLSGPHYGTSSAIRRLKLGESEARPVLRLPDEYSAAGPVGGIFGEMPFAKWADTLLVGFMPLPYLIVADTTGRELDRFEVPAVRRRGGTADPEAAIDEVLDGGRPYSEVFGLFSVTRGVHRRPDGTSVVVHFDMGTETRAVSTVGLWVTVIDESRRSACVDGAIPLEQGTRAAIGFEGDLVLVLEQVLRGGDSVTVLRRIEVDTDGCDWMPISR